MSEIALPIPSLPSGISKITVKPEFRNNGSSWGLECPMIFGEFDGAWLVWDRHSGDVIHVGQEPKNQHGYSRNHLVCSAISRPALYDQNPAIYDGVA